jgi:hypothetical protein
VVSVTFYDTPPAPFRIANTNNALSSDHNESSTSSIARSERGFITQGKYVGWLNEEHDQNTFSAGSSQNLPG